MEFSNGFGAEVYEPYGNQLLISRKKFSIFALAALQYIGAHSYLAGPIRILKPEKIIFFVNMEFSNLFLAEVYEHYGKHLLVSKINFSQYLHWLPYSTMARIPTWPFRSVSVSLRK